MRRARRCHDPHDLVEGAARYWWVFLVVGVLWLWVALIVLRLDLTTVYAISIMFGIVAIGAGLSEFFSIPASSSGWKWVHGLLGVVFVAAGIVAFFRPTNTFVALAAIVGWVLLLKGTFDLVLFSSRPHEGKSEKAFRIEGDKVRVDPDVSPGKLYRATVLEDKRSSAEFKKLAAEFLPANRVEN